MNKSTPTRKELLRPLHLLAIAGGAGLFAGLVTLMATGGFTSEVYRKIAMGQMEGQHPALLAVIVGGIAFIATLLLLSVLLLAVDPAEVTKGVDRPVLLDEPVAETDAATPDAADAASDEPDPSAS